MKYITLIRIILLQLLSTKKGDSQIFALTERMKTEYGSSEGTG